MPDGLVDGQQLAIGSMKEVELQRNVEELFRLRGWLVHHTRVARGSEPGLLDLVMIRPPRVIFAELKTQKGQLDNRMRWTKGGRRLPTQKEWFEALQTCPGVEVYLWRPSDWFGALIDPIAE